MKAASLALVTGTLLLGGCVASPTPTEQRMMMGTAGGAVVGQVLGGNTRSTLAGATLGAILAGATASPGTSSATTTSAPSSHPCADIYARYGSNPDKASDLCEMRMGRL